MTEREASPLTEQLERRLETVRTNVGLMIRRCRRKGWQPRKYLAQEITDYQKRNQVIPPELLAETKTAIEAMPDIDWKSADDEQLAESAFDVLRPLVTDRLNRRELQTGPELEWMRIGHFGMEEEPGERGAALRLHIPPLDHRPTLGEFRTSLADVADYLRAHPDIQEVTGSSLLLEHPLLQRLGFEIDPESDDGQVPSTHMSREEFLSRFGKPS